MPLSTAHRNSDLSHSFVWNHRKPQTPRVRTLMNLPQGVTLRFKHMVPLYFVHSTELSDIAQDLYLRGDNITLTE